MSELIPIVKTIAFGYYVLGFMRSSEGLNGELPPENLREWLRERFEREWIEAGELGRKVLEGE